MKPVNAWIGLGLSGLLLAAGCPKQASTGGAAKPAPSPPPSQTVPAPAPSAPEAPKAEPPPSLPPDQPPKEPEVAKAPVITPGGVEVEDLVIGTGAEVKPHQTITFFYRGTLKSNGKEFESNFGGKPAVYPLDRLVAGWQEGIPGMKVGGKRKLTIPYKLGYGEAGSPPTIPPKADLIFEIEVVGAR